MAPEQVRGVLDVDARADIFALGVLLHECLTGEPVFSGDQVVAVMFKVLMQEVPELRLSEQAPPGLSRLIAGMLNKERERRPRDAAAVLAELSQLGAAPASPATLVAASRRLGQSERRLVSVVLAGPPRLRRADLEQARTLASAEVPPGLERVKELASTQGARLEVLADGTLALVFVREGDIVELAWRAAAAALELSSALADRKIALATGRAEVGLSVPVGEALDRAAKLLVRESTTGEGVVTDPLTASLISGRFEVIGTRAEPILVRQLRSTARVRTLLGKPSPCVGRGRDIAFVRSVFEESVAEPVARVLLVSGGPGIGKSRLRYEILQELSTQSAAPAVWMARADALGAGSAFGLLAQLLRGALGLHGGEPDDAVRDVVRARALASFSDKLAPRMTSFLCAILGVDAADDPELVSARLDPVLMGDQKRLAWEALLGAELQRGPVVIVLEDLHLGDLPTVAAIDAALRTFGAMPLMVLALARPEIHERIEGLFAERDLIELQLHPLTRSASEKLARAVLGDAVGSETLEQIITHAQGNPLHLEELLRAVADGTETLPDTLLAMVQARLETLDVPKRLLLRAGAVFGEVFWSGAARALLGEDADASETHEHLEALERAELLTRRSTSRFMGHTEWVFRHALVRDAAYAMLTANDCEVGHRLAGEWLESVSERDARVLAQHFELGAEPGRAIALYARAAARALEGGDFGAAIDSSQRAIAAGAEGELLGEVLVTRASALRWRGSSLDALDTFRHALELLPPGTQTWYVAVSQLAIACAMASDRAGLEALREALAELPRDDEPSAAALFAWVHVADGLLTLGAVDAADELVAWAAPNADRMEQSEPRAAARIRFVVGHQALKTGDRGAYVEATRKSAVLLQGAGDSRAASSLRVNLGWALASLGDFEAALTEIDDALVTAERLALKPVLALAHHNRVVVLAALGRIDEARASANKAIALARGLDSPAIEANTHSDFARMLLAHDELEAAEREACAALDLARSAPQTESSALAALSAVLCRRGRAKEALTAATKAVSVAETGGNDEDALTTAQLALAEAFAAGGDRERALATIRIALWNLDERANALSGAAWRQSFLEGVPAHARLRELLAELEAK